MKSLITVSLTMLMLVTGRSVAGQNDSKPPITIALTVETPTAKTGATVSIRAVLTNNSKQPLDASGCYCGPSGLDSLFTWEAAAGRLYHLTKPRQKLKTVMLNVAFTSDVVDSPLADAKGYLLCLV